MSFSNEGYQITFDKAIQKWVLTYFGEIVYAHYSRPAVENHMGVLIGTQKYADSKPIQKEPLSGLYKDYAFKWELMGHSHITW